MEIRNRRFKVCWLGRGAGERAAYWTGKVWAPLARSIGHLSYWTTPKGRARGLALVLRETGPERLLLAGNVRGLGEFFLEYRTPADRDVLEVDSRFVCRAAAPVAVGFYLPAIEPPEDVDALRLLMGTYGGYTRRGMTLLFRHTYDEAAGPLQTALAVDMAPHPRGTTRTRYQRLVLSFPPAYCHGAMRVEPGQEVRGGLIVERRPEHIWSPALSARERRRRLPAPILPPRYRLRRYLANWERFAKHPDLWVPLGAEMGLYHVGFYGMLTKTQMGGPYGWSLNGKPIRYRDVHDWFHGSARHAGKVLKGYQEHARQCEIGWGNGGNAMVAYAHFLCEKPWFVRRAHQMVNAILGLEGRGFQIPDGPLAGAWINGYDADARRFQDHYGGQQVFLPDQGIVNFFLTRCYVEGHHRDPRIVERVTTNCDRFLDSVESRYGFYPNAFGPDGSIGYSREGVRYDWTNAPAVAYTMVSYLGAYQLTRRKTYLDRAEDLLARWLAPEIAAHRFGFLEYDHAGWDSSGPAAMLICLGAYLREPAARQKPLARRIEGQVFDHLMSFRHEHDYFLGAHSHNTDGWGAIPRNRFGFLHGFTPGSSQGAICLHLRYEYAYGLLQAYLTRPTAERYEALMNYLNLRTYHQFVNAKLPFGFGGATEHIALAPYVQDTTHVLHSTPLAALALRRWPAFLSACTAPARQVRLTTAGVVFRLRTPAKASVDSLSSETLWRDGESVKPGKLFAVGSSFCRVRSACADGGACARPKRRRAAAESAPPAPAGKGAADAGRQEQRV